MRGSRFLSKRKPDKTNSLYTLQPCIPSILFYKLFERETCLTPLIFKRLLKTVLQNSGLISSCIVTLALLIPSSTTRVPPISSISTGNWSTLANSFSRSTLYAGSRLRDDALRLTYGEGLSLLEDGANEVGSRYSNANAPGNVRLTRVIL